MPNAKAAKSSHFLSAALLCLVDLDAELPKKALHNQGDPRLYLRISDSCLLGVNDSGGGGAVRFCMPGSAAN